MVRGCRDRRLAGAALMVAGPHAGAVRIGAACGRLRPPAAACAGAPRSRRLEFGAPSPLRGVAPWPLRIAERPRGDPIIDLLYNITIIIGIQ